MPEDLGNANISQTGVPEVNSSVNAMGSDEAPWDQKAYAFEKSRTDEIRSQILIEKQKTAKLNQILKQLYLKIYYRLFHGN